MADDAASGGAAPPPHEPQPQAPEARGSALGVEPSPEPSPTQHTASESVEPSPTPDTASESAEPQATDQTASQPEPPAPEENSDASAPASSDAQESGDPAQGDEVVSAAELEALSADPPASDLPPSDDQSSTNEPAEPGAPEPKRPGSSPELRFLRPPRSHLFPTRPARTEWWQSRRTVWLAAGSLGLCLLIALDVIWMRRAAEHAPDSANSAQPPLQSAPVASAIAVPSSVVPGAELDDGSEEPRGVEPKAAAENDDTALPAFDEDDVDSEPSPKKPKQPPHFGTVQEAAARSCSTASVDGLSRQIIEQGRCINPKAFVPLPSRPNLVVGEHVFAYLESSARDRLLRALDSRKKSTMTINSALRTVAQQYLVWRWSASKRCGVQLATPPGESNHETGLALDIAEQADWRQTLEQHDFHWLGSIDRVHFDYKGDTGSSSSQRAVDVLAFQQLWNRNNPNDPIAESGHYSPETEQRLKKAPADGFAIGSACKGRAPKPSPLSNTGKHRR